MKRRARKDASSVKIRFWIDKELRSSNLWDRDRAALADLSDLSEPAPSNSRRWFAGTAPLLPLTEPLASHRADLSTVLARILIGASALSEKEKAASRALLERAHAVAVASLHEKTAPFDVVELASVVSEDDDDLVIILDAVVRKAQMIRTDSPLHPSRLVLQVLTANRFSEKALTELLFDDDTGKKAAFPMVCRLYEWATEDYEQGGLLRETARSWRRRFLLAGTWREVMGEDEEEEKEDVQEEKNDEDGRSDGDNDEEMGGQEPDEDSDREVEDEEEKNDGRGDGEDREVSDREEDEEEEHETAPFLIRVVQLVGTIEEEKTFLFPAEEEPHRLVLPARLVGNEQDVWPRLIRMTKRLSRDLQRHVKLRPTQTDFRKECRELIGIIDRFMDVAREN